MLKIFFVVAGVIWLSLISIDTTVAQQQPDANSLISAGQYAAAVPVLTNQIKASPNDAHLWILLGQAYIGLNNPISAQDAFNHAMTLDGQAHLTVARIYLEAGDGALEKSDTVRAQQFYQLAVQYDASLGAKIASSYFDHAKAALQLRDVKTAEPLFNTAVQFDPSRKRDVAAEFTHAAETQYTFNDFEATELYLKDAAKYDPDAARNEAESMFEKFSPDICQLPSIGKQRFLSAMKLFTDVTLPDSTKSSIAYRFAFGIELLEIGPRAQSIDILKDIATSPASCQQAAAKELLAPPAPGKRQITEPGLQHRWGGVAEQVLYADVRANDIVVTVSISNVGSGAFTLVIRPLGVPWNCTLPPDTVDFVTPEIQDDNGITLKPISTYTGSALTRLDQSICVPRMQYGPMGRKLQPGEQVILTVEFPTVTSGAQQFKFIQADWSSDYIRLKPDPFGS